MSQQPKISFIYFDLGGVIEIDFTGNSGWDDLKKELGVTPDKSDQFDEIYDEYEKQICTTRDIEDLKEVFNKRLGLDIPANYSLMNGFISKFEKNPGIWPIVEKAKSKYRIGLFTMIYPGMFTALQNARLLPNIDWDTIVDSSVVRFTKYDTEMFDIATRKAGVLKEEILLIENSKRHVETAIKYGWQTFYYDTKEILQSNKKLSQYLFN